MPDAGAGGPKREKPAGAIPPQASPGAHDANVRRGDAAPAREAKSALRERDALPSRSLSLQYSRRRRA